MSTRQAWTRSVRLWGIKEHVRQLLTARDTPSFQRHWARLESAVRATRLAEPAALFRTLRAWRRELLTFSRLVPI